VAESGVQQLYPGFFLAAHARRLRYPRSFLVVLYVQYSGVLQCVYDGNFTRDGMRYVGSDVWSDLLLFGVVEFPAIEIQRSQQQP
jgi:hypothetical protein